MRLLCSTASSSMLADGSFDASDGPPRKSMRRGWIWSAVQGVDAASHQAHVARCNQVYRRPQYS